MLVVDDEPSNRLVLYRTLRHARNNAVTVGSAVDALRKIEEHGAFTLYVLDVLMPRLRGTALADRIREFDPNARVLYFTAFAHSEFGSTGRTLGPREAVLQKPATNKELLDAVSMLLFGHDRGLTSALLPEHEVSQAVIFFSPEQRVKGRHQISPTEARRSRSPVSALRDRHRTRNLTHYGHPLTVAAPPPMG